MIVEGGAFVLPCEVRVYTVDIDHFEEFVDELSRLTANNIPAVQAKLTELGLSLASITS